MGIDDNCTGLQNCNCPICSGEISIYWDKEEPPVCYKCGKVLNEDKDDYIHAKRDRSFCKQCNEGEGVNL